MGIGPYSHLKAPAIIFFVVFISWIISFQAPAAEARANLTAYTTTPPNTWEMKGFNTTGSAPWFIVNTLGFNYTKTLGNVGVGNGSLRALNATGNRVINYTEQYTIAGDVSMAPFDPARLTTVSVSGVNVETGTETNISVPEFESETASHNRTSPLSRIQAHLSNTSDQQLFQQSSSNEPLCGDYPCTTTYRVLPKKDSANQPARALEKGNNTTLAPGQIGGNVPLNDPYHSILLGRPIDDMLYEHPHGIATNAYGRLTGLQLPGGGIVNVGLRCLGYGY